MQEDTLLCLNDWHTHAFSLSLSLSHSIFPHLSIPLIVRQSSWCYYHSVFYSRSCVFVWLCVRALCSAMNNVITVCLCVFIYVCVCVCSWALLYLLFAEPKWFSPVLGRSKVRAIYLHFKLMPCRTHWELLCTSRIKEWWIPPRNENNTTRCDILLLDLHYFIVHSVLKNKTKVVVTALKKKERNQNWIVLLGKERKTGYVCYHFFVLSSWDHKWIIKLLNYYVLTVFLSL